MSQVEKRSSKVRTHNLLMAMRVICMNKCLRVPGVKMIKSHSKYLSHFRCPTLQSLVSHPRMSTLLLWQENSIITSKNSQCNNPPQCPKQEVTLTSQSRAWATKTNAKSWWTIWYTISKWEIPGEKTKGKSMSGGAPKNSRKNFHVCTTAAKNMQLTLLGICTWERSIMRWPRLRGIGKQGR